MSPVKPLSMAIVDRRFRRGHEDRDEADETHADHEGRRARGGSLRVAHRVLARELAGDTAHPRQRCADHPAQRQGDGTAEDRDSEEDQQRAGADDQHRLVDAAEQAENSAATPRARTASADEDALFRAVSGAAGDAELHGRDRRHLGRLTRRGQRRQRP